MYNNRIVKFGFILLLILMLILVGIVVSFKNINNEDEDLAEDEEYYEEKLILKDFLSKFKIGFLLTICAFAVVGIIESIKASSAISIIDIFLYVLLPVYSILISLEIIQILEKKLHPFSGQIKSHNDIDDFLTNYKYFSYFDNNGKTEFRFLIVNSVGLILNGGKLKFVTPGIYFSLREDTNINEMDKICPYLYIKESVWEDRKLINTELKRRRLVKEDALQVAARA